MASKCMASKSPHATMIDEEVASENIITQPSSFVPKIWSFNGRNPVRNLLHPNPVDTSGKSTSMDFALVTFLLDCTHKQQGQATELLAVAGGS